MSLHKFITDMLNIKPDNIDKIDSFDFSDGSVKNQTESQERYLLPCMRRKSPYPWLFLKKTDPFHSCQQKMHHLL